MFSLQFLYLQGCIFLEINGEKIFLRKWENIYTPAFLCCWDNLYSVHSFHKISVIQNKILLTQCLNIMFSFLLVNINFNDTSSILVLLDVLSSWNLIDQSSCLNLPDISSSLIDNCCSISILGQWNARLDCGWAKNK